MTSREQRLNTKEHIATHTIFSLVSLAQYSGTLAIKLFKSNIKLYYAGILTVTLQASLSL